MFLIGPTCTGAVLVSLSATKGSNIFRVKRDDEVRNLHDTTTILLLTSLLLTLVLLDIQTVYNENDDVDQEILCDVRTYWKKEYS